MPWHAHDFHDSDGPLVILLHGLWRSRLAMQPLARRLQAHGYATLNLPYPSARMTISCIHKRLAPMILKASENRETHWITHSLGGIVARSILQDPIFKPRKLIMLAPPNRGSEVVDQLSQIPLLSKILGPAGRELGTQGAAMTIPNPPTSVGTMVIMGNQPKLSLFRRLLAPENDGIVSVQSGALTTPHEFYVVDADHTFIQIHPQTIQLCLGFLARP